MARYRQLAVRKGFMNRKRDLSAQSGPDWLQSLPTGSAQEFFERSVGLGAELGGLRVMAFGQVLGRRLRRCVNDGEIGMRVGIRRIIGDGREHFFFGGFLPAFLARGDAEIIVGGGTLGINGERLRQFSESGVELRLPIE